MSKLTERISYLRGLAAGLRLDPSQDTNRLVLEMLEVLQEAAGSIEELTQAHNDLCDHVDTLDDDLADLENNLFGEDEEEQDSDSEDEEEQDDSGLVDYPCPHCGAILTLNMEKVNFDDDLNCPVCGKPVFQGDSGEED